MFQTHKGIKVLTQRIIECSLVCINKVEIIQPMKILGTYEFNYFIAYLRSDGILHSLPSDYQLLDIVIIFDIFVST